MKTIRNVAIGLVALVVMAIAAGFLLPRTVSVERSIIINAPQQAVFRIVNSLRVFSLWSPWTSLDPGMKFTFEGPDSGVGQKMTWNSEKAQVGTGSMEIVDSLMDEKVVLLIKFAGMGEARSNLALTPTEGGTKVTWSYTSDVGGNPLARYMGLIVPSVVGNEYSKGLENLKRYVELIPKADTSSLVVSRISVAPQQLIMMSVRSDDDADAMRLALVSAFARLKQAAADAGLEQSGAPISIAKAIEGKSVVLQAALPIRALPQGFKLPDGIQAGATEEGQALRVAHRGSYASLGNTYFAMLAYALSNGWRIKGSSWNEYTGDPAANNGTDLQANIYLPVE